jgi:hypothetical protein
LQQMSCSRRRLSLFMPHITAHVGSGMNLGIEIQLYERKKMA